MDEIEKIKRELRKDFENYMAKFETNIVLNSIRREIKKDFENYRRKFETNTVLNLRRDYGLVETTVKRVVKDGDRNRYLAVVFKDKRDEFCWFYQDCGQPFVFHKIATGFKDEESAKEGLADTLGIDKGCLG